MVGLSNSLFLPASRAIAVTIEPGNVAHRLSVLGGVELAGFVTGPVLGGLLVGPFGLRVPFLAAGAFALAGGLMLLPRDLPQPPIGPSSGLAFDLLRIRRIRAGVFLSVALFVPVGFYDAVLDRYMTDRGASNAMIGLAFLAFGIPFAIVAAFGGRLADRRGALRVGLISAALVVPITIGYGFVAVPMVIVLMSAVEGIIQALGSPASQAVVASGAPHRPRRGRARPRGLDEPAGRRVHRLRGRADVRALRLGDHVRHRRRGRRPVRWPRRISGTSPDEGDQLGVRSREARTHALEGVAGPAATRLGSQSAER